MSLETIMCKLHIYINTTYLILASYIPQVKKEERERERVAENLLTINLLGHVMVSQN